MANFITCLTAGLEYLYRGDANPLNDCFLQSTWTDPTAKGQLAIVPAAMIITWGDLWYQLWPEGHFVNNHVEGTWAPTSGNNVEFLSSTTPVLVHYRANGTIVAVGFVYDPHGLSILLHAEVGRAHPVVAAAIANATTYDPAGFVVLDVRQHPNGWCCAPHAADGRVTERAGASKGRQPNPSPPHYPLPQSVATAGAAGFPDDCAHNSTFAWAFEGDPAAIHLSRYFSEFSALGLQTASLMLYQVWTLEVIVAEAHADVVGGHGENGLLARLPRLDLNWDPRDATPRYPSPLREFAASVKAFRVDVVLRAALARVALTMSEVVSARAWGSRHAEKAEAECAAALPNVLATIGGFVALRAHDYFSQPWAPIADPFVRGDFADAGARRFAGARALASLTRPSRRVADRRVDVFPTSDAVGRDVAAACLRLMF